MSSNPKEQKKIQVFGRFGMLVAGDARTWAMTREKIQVHCMRSYYDKFVDIYIYMISPHLMIYLIMDRYTGKDIETWVHNMLK